MADVSSAETPAQNVDDAEATIVQAAKQPASNVATNSCATCRNHKTCELMKLKLAFKPSTQSR